MNSYQLANAMRYQSILTRSLPLPADIASGVRSREKESHYIVTVSLSALADACIALPSHVLPHSTVSVSLPYAFLDIDCTHLKQAAEK